MLPEENLKILTPDIVMNAKKPYETPEFLKLGDISEMTNDISVIV